MRKPSSTRPFPLLTLCPMALAFLFAGCGGDSEPGDGPELFPVTLQTDWYAQPEHGGFYQALEYGLYRDAGLDVTILEGGPATQGAQRLAQGTVQFILGRSDDIIIQQSRGVSMIIVMALMQHDPQALLLHASNPIDDFPELDGHSIMTTPGSAIIEFLERKYRIDVNVIPLDYGLARFAADPGFIQQCFITNEPYFVRQEGLDPKVLLLSDSGFDPYRIVATSTNFLTSNPEIVRQFVAASIHGWRDYLFGEHARTHEKIASLNERMTPEFMSYARQAMLDYELVAGEGNDPANIGLLEPERLREQMETLLDLGLIDEAVPEEDFYSIEFLPEPVRKQATEESAEPAGPVSLIPAEGDPFSFPVNPERTSPTDLEIRAPLSGQAGDEPVYLAYDDLRGHPAVTELDAPIDWLDFEKRPVKALFLSDLQESLGLTTATDLILATCNDGYQANYTAEQIGRHEPFIVLEIDGEGPGDWGRKEDGTWFRGPYYFAIVEAGDLLDPTSKAPFGVYRLTFTTQRERFAELYAGKFASLPADAAAGREIFVNHCLNCHSSPSTIVGGTMSNRTMPVLAAHAKFNRDYFDQFVMDPPSLMPGIIMPGHPHYEPKHLDQLRAFLAHY